jgi:transcriptional regulator with XRE-family HTH domain
VSTKVYKKGRSPKELYTKYLEFFLLHLPVHGASPYIKGTCTVHWGLREIHIQIRVYLQNPGVILTNALCFCYVSLTLHQLQDRLHGVQTFAGSGLLLLWCTYNFTVMNELLKMLKSAREEKGFSQEYLSCKLNVSSSTISRWEMGKKEMTLQQVERYAAAVEINVKHLFAFLANEDVLPPSPLAEIYVEVFTKEAFDKISAIICSIGIDNATMTTKRLGIWK